MPRSTAKTDLALAGLVACAASLSGSTALAPHVVVVGGGWGGMGAAKAACEAGCKVTLLDALPDPTGRTPFLSASGKPVEAGTRGFWKDYPNIEAMMGELGLSEDEVFTPFLNSSFYSPFGLEATAPVFSEGVQLAALQGAQDGLHILSRAEVEQREQRERSPPPASPKPRRRDGWNLPGRRKRSCASSAIALHKALCTSSLAPSE